ncbi:putative protein LDOC1-like protein [Labeo rohita]|uniref:Uncharacterized protein n=1 Tax=Labeo rohita TaxID=84645 RepID=A0A498MQZ8_LABRO|nr:putative protein LDOC1-like protein [Labeo rohita]
MDPAKETPIRSAVELQGAMLERHQEELSAASHPVLRLRRLIIPGTPTAGLLVPAEESPLAALPESARSS